MLKYYNLLDNQLLVILQSKRSWDRGLVRISIQVLPHLDACKFLFNNSEVTMPSCSPPDILKLKDLPERSSE